MEPEATKSASSPTAALRRKLYRYAYARITVTVLLALLCAGILLSVANDTYAFVKADREAVLTVEETQSVSEWAWMLKRHGVIENPTVFGWYVRAKGQTERLESFSGVLTLNASMSYREILLAFAAEPEK